MKICMLSELFYPYLVGGAERRYYEIAVRLARKHEVTVYSLRFDGHERREEHRGIEIIRVGSSHPLDKRSIPALATYLPALFKAVLERSDIIDANQGISSFIGALKPLTRTPIVATFHDLYWNQWNEYFPFPFSSIGKAMEFLWSKLPYTAVIANSPNTEKKLRQISFSRVYTIPSGLDLNFIKNVKAKKRKNRIVYVGRLVKYKNIDTLIRAVKEASREVNDTELVIVGSGPAESELKSLSESIGVDAKFLGFVSEEEKFSIIKSSSALVNPSSVEGLGIILLESMAAGVPVVAKNLEAYFFCNNKNSVIYDDDSQLADKITEVLYGNKRNTLIKNGYNTAKQYSWDNVSKNVENFYMNVIEG